MSAIDYYIDVFKNKYADFSGRARRSEYWYFALFNMLATIAASLVDYFIFGFSILYFLYAIGALVPSIAVSIRRLHDTNRSGWWFLIILIPFIGVIVLFVFLATAGTIGKNEYGSDPKNPADEDDIIAHLVD